MTNKEPSVGITDSDELVQPLLAARFELEASQLPEDSLLRGLAERLQAMVGNEAVVLSLVGGAGSGKTTLSRLLIEKLAAQGVSADVISTDDYNRGDRKWRWEHFEGETVRDPLGKWDFGFMNEKIAAIRKNKVAGTVVKVPTYNQATGEAIDEGEENYKHAVGPVDVLVVEGDMAQVKNPDISIYLHTSDTQRLENRIQRDLEHRSAVDAEKITANFNLRHTNQHVPYTLPAIEAADIVVCAAKAEDGERTYELFRVR